MDNHVTLDTALKRLGEQNIRFAALDLGGGYQALVTEYGGRLIGPFQGGAGESVTWLNQAFLDADAFRALIEGRAWNLGGERLWVNPELKFFCKSPETFDETYTVQPALDPGDYALAADGGGVDLTLHPTVKVLGTGADKSFSLKRRYTPAANPLGYIKALKDADIRYCGVTQDIVLTDTSPETPMTLEPWILTQINPGGKVITPVMGEMEFLDYYEPAGDCQRFGDGYAELSMTGRQKFKVAYRAAQTFGRMAYLREARGEWQLMVRNYYNDPSMPYVSEPWGDLDNRGCSTYYYNDDGRTGGFAEFENSCAVIGPDAGRSQSTSTTSLWHFFGNREDIHAVMRTLLGVDYRF